MNQGMICVYGVHTMESICIVYTMHVPYILMTHLNVQFVSHKLNSICKGVNKDLLN